MQEQLQLLRDLQALDQKKLDIDQQRQQQSQEMAALQVEVDRLQQMVDTLDGQTQEIEAAHSELKLSLTKEQDNIGRAEARLPQIKTQKEYVAVLKEIDTAKKLAKELEEQIAANKQEIDALQADRDEKAGELQTVQDACSEQRDAIEARLGELDGELTTMVERRGALLGQLPTALRKRYELLLSRRGGIAVVEARGGACLGCNMHLPPQQFNSLYVASEVQSCPHCNRLLYVENPG
ncbi:MAG: C4-type zinc ribbon domain-containing protein [Desulfuromonadales bacterium]|nr:C4-type zinc ribbon domain-containing protein [Desulfuromonadales bacterium]